MNVVASIPFNVSQVLLQLMFFARGVFFQDIRFIALLECSGISYYIVEL